MKVAYESKHYPRGLALIIFTWVHVLTQFPCVWLLSIQVSFFRLSLQSALALTFNTSTVLGVCMRAAHAQKDGSTCSECGVSAIG